jgi:hypothetical protein
MRFFRRTRSRSRRHGRRCALAAHVPRSKGPLHVLYRRVH